MSLERFTEINKMITMISKIDIVSNKLKRSCKTILYIESLFSGKDELGERISIDEKMIAFKKKIKNRIYSPLKPDKWGMKFYVCAEFTAGYVLNMRICEEFSTLENTVKNLTRFLTGKYRRLYMDNYYNSFSMTKALISSEIYVCGTLRDRRGGPDKLTKLKKALLKGTQTVFSKSEVEVLIWNDKRQVAMITNCHDTRCVLSDKGKTISSYIKNIINTWKVLINLIK
ncbi:PiggyBac transposable element-derived protein 4 [Cucumispora dikerogammari]|nr:PiggyBac transposable element-derived protein 4 [Cucumispora dikerogammari]